MTPRRTLLLAAAGLLLARAAGAQSRGSAPADDDLQDRGAPTGRIGAATRGAGPLSLDLVAPLRGVGLTGSDQPVLFYLLAGDVAAPVRLTISPRGQARPLADLDIPRPRSAGPAAIRLRDHDIRLRPDQLCVWSVSVVLDRRAPSRDLVASALVRYRPIPTPLRRALDEAPPERRPALLADAGYWYDGVALAEQARAQDGGVALAALLQRVGLPVRTARP